MIYEAIDAKKAETPVHRGCRLFGVSMSGYYAWKRRQPSRRQHDDMILLAHVRNHFALSYISDFWTAEGWLYLAIVVDLHSRRIIGWATSDRMKKDLAMRALRRAISLRRPPKDVIHHSDRGSQYCSADYQKILKDGGFVLSMSGKGNCYDNATVETVFKTLKAELIWRTIFLSRSAAKISIGRCIDGFYNPVRRHSALGYKSPCDFEAAA